MAQESPSDQHADGSYIAQAGPGGRASITVSPTPPPPTDLNRRRLLSKVRTFRITDELESSLRRTTFIELGLQERPDAVIKSQRPILRDADYPILPLPSDMHITQVYDRAGEELLILGAPGTGKTTLLLQLTRDLLDRARQDESHPIPAVFNLSSWATKRQPLGEWLVDELHIGYQVSPKLGQEWVAENRILPLLDGLDEVVAEHRTACIEAINTYRDEHGLVPMVVCCRSADYDALASSTRLSLCNAIVVQPLTTQQVDDYLASGGEKLSALREVLQTDPDLQEMAATPLMLSVLTQAYAGRRPDDLLVANSPQLRRQQIFATYVERMLHRRGPKSQYTPQQVKHWLSWLAKQMTQHGQTEFYLERMQPDWLSSEKGWLSLFFGAFVRVSIWLFFGLVAWLTFGLHNGLLSSSQPSMSGNTPVYGLIFGLIGGLVYSLVSQVDTSIKPVETIRWSPGSIWQRLKKSETALAGLLFALLGGLLGWLDPQELLNRPIEMLLGGLIFGVLGGLLFSLLIESAAELARNTREQETHTTLNQGTWHSVYNRVLVGLIFGLVNGLIFGFLIALLVGMIEIQVNNPSSVLQDMLSHGLISGISIWILSGLLFGARCRIETELKPMRVFVCLCRSIQLRLVKSEDLTRGLAFGLIFALLFWTVEMAQRQSFMLAEGLVYADTYTQVMTE